MRTRVNKDKLSPMLPSIDYTPSPDVHDDDLSAVVAETRAGSTYAFSTLYSQYEAVAFANGRTPASRVALGLAFKALGWRKARVQHGTVRVWTRP